MRPKVDESIHDAFEDDGERLTVRNLGWRQVLRFRVQLRLTKQTVVTRKK